MKICPTCQNRYTDDTLQFCLQDGTNLVSDESQNVMPTVAFNDESETVVKSRQPSGAADYQTEPKSSNTALIVAVTLLAMLFVFGAIGIGAWLYFGNNKEVAQNTNVKSSFPDNSIKNSNENTSVFPPVNATEKPTVRPTIETKTPAPPDFNPEEIKTEVSGTVNSWASSAESRNLSAYMNNYADTVDYYNKKGASVGTVRADKQRAFTIYDTLEINLSNMRVTPDASGESATAVFDKEWYFENDRKSSEGKVQTQLRLRKIGGAWKITSEKDLKVYYVN